MGKKNGKKAAKREKKARKHARLDVRLHGVPEIRRFFRADETPISFVCATPFHLLGVDHWVRRLEYVCRQDPFDGHHPRAFSLPAETWPEFASVEEACNQLLARADVTARIRSRGPGKVLLPACDENTERLASEAGLSIAAPPAELRRRLDSTVLTAQLGAEAGVPSVPHVVGRASSFGVLHALSASAGLGHDLAVQPPRGDSGQTTAFIASEADWNAHAEVLAGQELKVMKRIDCRRLGMQAVITRHGTLVGPLVSELTSFTERIPGEGRCLREAAASTLPDDRRREARSYARAIGEGLRQEGYRGYVELAFLIDADTDALFLDGLDPRMSDTGSLANVAAVASADTPLVLFHLLEHMDVDYELDVDALDAEWSAPWATPTWTVLFLDRPSERSETTAERRAGIWRLDADALGGVRFDRRETDWQDVAGEDEAFFVSCGQGAGILVARGSLQTEDGGLTERALVWATGLAAARESDRQAPVIR